MILLINPAVPPNSPWGPPKLLPPLGLAYVAASLEQAGFHVEILDNYLYRESPEQIAMLVKEKKPKIVGISCNSVNYKECIKIARAIKDHEPSCKIIVGGPHPSCSPESILEHEEIDYAIIGEGERATVGLVKHVLKENENKSTLNIPGVAYKYRGEIHKNQPMPIENLDSIPFPARHLLKMDKYDREIEYLDVKPADIMSVIRGCPYNCKFCETKKIWGYKCRAFSPSRIISEIEYLMENYGSRGIYFIGDNFTIFRDKTLKLCRLLVDRKINIEWACDTRVDLISEELLVEMKKAGCKTIWFGVESGSPRVLERLNKGVTLHQIKRAFRICRKVGIRTACSFMIGTPYEKLEDIEASFRLAKELDPDWCQFNIYIGCPGSELYEEIIDKGLYDQIDGFITYVRTNDFDYNRLLEIQKKFMKNFYNSPKRVIQGMRRKLLRFLKSI
ncbi:MAG: radical SAM protein [Candidatus Bathyarchaeia archaeon]